MKLVFASNNAHKLCEVRAMMPAGIEVLSLHEIGFEHEIDETGTTLAENSKIKADTVAEWLKAHDKWSSVDGVFADDTGLEIDALNGQPGVYSARWAGSAESNRAKALHELEGKDNRNCHFKTVITLITNDRTTQVEGLVRGKITTEEYGHGGFGYDPEEQRQPPSKSDSQFSRSAENVRLLRFCPFIRARYHLGLLSEASRSYIGLKNIHDY